MDREQILSMLESGSSVITYSDKIIILLLLDIKEELEKSNEVVITSQEIV